MKLTNIFSRLLAVFGLLLLLSVSGWGACSGTSVATWNTSTTTYSDSDSSFTNSYYTITVTQAGILNLSVYNASSGSHTRNITASLYPNGTCTSTATWSSGSISELQTAYSGDISVSVGTYTLQLSRSSSYSSGYSWSGTFAPNAPPVITNTSRNVDENSPAGTLVGIPITATNSPTGFAITGGTGQSLFNIDSSGQITVKTGVVLDYETTASYTLTVTATNSAGSGSANITINLNNITGPTIISGQTFSIVGGSANGTYIGTLAVTIPTPLPSTNTTTSYTSSDSAFTISHTGAITVADSGGLTVGTHTVTVVATNAEGTDTKTITINVTAPSADLALTNTDSPDPVITNSSLTYTLGVTNNGPQTATSLTLTDTLPAGVTYLNASGTGWSCSQSSGTVTCTNSSLASGASSNVTITLTSPSTAGTITNTATVTSAVTDPTPANNTNITQSTTVNTPSADLALTKTAPANALTNNTIQYTITVTNNGPADTDNLTVIDDINASETYQNAYGTDWICTYTSATRRLSCLHPTTLANGDSTSITLIVAAPSTASTVKNYASVTSLTTDPNMANNTNFASTTVTATSINSNNPRSFTLQKQYNIYGDMTIIGNSVMVKKNGTSWTCPSMTERNNVIAATYADIDNNASTFDSSSAELKLPVTATNKEIVWAGLYWQGYLVNDSADKAKANSVLLKTPISSSYVTMTSDITKFNWLYVTGSSFDRFYYQGVADITAIVKAAGEGNYTVANLYSSTLDGFSSSDLNTVGGAFGAWSIVVVYKDSSTTIKNISVYDGYVSIGTVGATSDGPVYNDYTLTLSGFLTPTLGTINSNFLVFAGEGDLGGTGDYTKLSSGSNLTNLVSLYNAKNPANDIYNSSITDDGVPVTTRSPNCENTIGADIDKFDVGSTASTTTQGQIIQNSQTSTNVNLTTSGDGYFPGVFAFSTQLYVPDVCYLEDVSYNGAAISSTNIPSTGDNVTYEVSVTNKNSEAAKGVFIEKIFDKPNEITYVPNSMSIAPIPGTTYTPKSDAIGDDTAEYNSDTDTAKFLLGDTAQWYQGGTLSQNAITKFKYDAKLGDQNASENTYLVSYRNDLLHITFSGIPIRKCQDFNNSFSVYTPVIGAYNTVHSGAVNINTDSDPLDPSDVKNALYTQVVNQSFSVDLLSLDTNNITPVNSSKDVNLSIVELPSDGNCDNATLLQTVTPTIPINGLKLKTVTITPIRASKNAVFKMATDTVSLCSRDRFAIRPASFSMDTNVTSPLIGNRQYMLTATANQSGSTSPSVGYNQTIDNTVNKNTTTQLVLPTGCGLPNPLQNISTALPFGDGTVSAVIVYPNVGDVNLTITDSDWTFVDSNNSKGDCIANSTSNIPVSGKVGCLIQSSKIFSFVPQTFNSLLTLANSSTGFTYISTDQNMSAPLTLNTTAVLDGGGTATNYTKDCFAKDINTTLSLMNNQNLSWGTSQARVKFFDDLNTTSRFLT
ncbi:MAG: hypothetical protein PHX13_09760, partial [Thiovulaceae bacterium]|nr:hypothetical protein [Sulfurimonadaceae bacterium]